MIPFERLNLNQREAYEQILMPCDRQGCEYLFVNKFLWGRQKVAFFGENLVFFSQFDRRSIYPFPVGSGDLKPALDAVIQDARERGIPCNITGMTEGDCALLEKLYPGQFRFHTDRDDFDYVYSIDDLAELKGRKYQKKRTHLNRFLQEHPNYRTMELDEHNRAQAYCMLQRWYAQREILNPEVDFHLEKLAMDRAFAFQKQLGLEGIVLMDEDEVLAFAMGSFLNQDTFDIHFEKAREDVPGAYNAINREFARHLRAKYPQLRWLNREDDMGLEGLRKAKLSYYPDHMVEKYWAKRWEEENDG